MLKKPLGRLTAGDESIHQSEWSRFVSFSSSFSVTHSHSGNLSPTWAWPVLEGLRMISAVYTTYCVGGKDKPRGSNRCLVFCPIYLIQRQWRRPSWPLGGGGGGAAGVTEDFRKGISVLAGFFPNLIITLNTTNDLLTLPSLRRLSHPARLSTHPAQAFVWASGGRE